jgi:hypothetical protein
MTAPLLSVRVTVIEKVKFRVTPLVMQTKWPVLALEHPGSPCHDQVYTPVPSDPVALKVTLCLLSTPPLRGDALGVVTAG